VKERGVLITSNDGYIKANGGIFNFLSNELGETPEGKLRGGKRKLILKPWKGDEKRAH